jgi:hypothetical protein
MTFSYSGLFFCHEYGNNRLVRTLVRQFTSTRQHHSHANKPQVISQASPRATRATGGVQHLVEASRLTAACWDMTPYTCFHIYEHFFRVAEQIAQGHWFLSARHDVVKWHRVVISKTAVEHNLILYLAIYIGFWFIHAHSRFALITVFSAILLQDSPVVWVSCE